MKIASFMLSSMGKSSQESSFSMYLFISIVLFPQGGGVRNRACHTHYITLRGRRQMIMIQNRISRVVQRLHRKDDIFDFFDRII